MYRERELARLWARVGRGSFRTVGGERLEVLSPGKFYGHGGPDFRGAVLRLENRLVGGDVEVHVRSSHWRRHRHHDDPRFRRLALHVVYEDDGPSGEAPVLALGRYLDSAAGSLLAPCGRLSSEALESLGEERFRRKAAAFLRRLEEAAPEQALYEGMMRALGYTENAEPMEELARRLPFRRLLSLIEGCGDGKALSVLLLLFHREAGLLRWRRDGVRPGNCPRRRLEGMARLIVRYRGGLPDALKEAVLRGLPGGLEDRLTAAPFIGKSRARDIAVNIVLPFFFALGYGEALRMFRSYPGSGSNYILRLMERRVVTPRPAVRAAQQQGLLHIYKEYCRNGSCSSCPVLA